MLCLFANRHDDLEDPFLYFTCSPDTSETMYATALPLLIALKIDCMLLLFK